MAETIPKLLCHVGHTQNEDMSLEDWVCQWQKVALLRGLVGRDWQNPPVLVWLGGT